MDTSLLQLFSTEEILKRLTEKEVTGALHVFTVKEAANLFFQAGIIVAACKGLMEGGEVLQKVMEWKDARFIWADGEVATASLKRLEINFPDFLSQQKMTIKVGAINKSPAAEAKDDPDTHPIISVPSRANTTGPMTMERPKALKKTFVEAKPQPSATAPLSQQDLRPVTTSLKATKSMSNGAREEDTFEEALMRRHQLALSSTGDTPSQRLRIIRSSNIVGRNPACDFILNHSSISRQHCLLQIMERGLHVKDLSTTNGTKVNGIPLTEGYISVGDKLSIGHLDFILEKDEPVA